MSRSFPDAPAARGSAPGPKPYSADPREGESERCSVLGMVLVLAFVAVAVGYLIWRTTTINQLHPVFSWLLYAAEAYGVVGALVHIFIMWRLTKRVPPAAPDGLSVDVFVTCFNEPVSMLRRTLLLARDMDYPHQTWLLDDGNRPEMRGLADSLGVHYLTRADNAHAKAGNLNNALAHTQGDFIALFDADHAPRRDFLVKTLGYFLDPKVALVQTPQEFFNLNSFQHRVSHRTHRMWTEQSLFFKVLQRGKDYWNAAFFCGTCAVVRRQSIDHIGGFAVGTVTEDLHTSIKLHKAGLLSVYHAESLAFGIAPAQIEPFLAQRVRWGQGAMQVLRKEGVLLTPHLTLAQKINYLASMTTYFDGWQKAIFWLAPVVVLLTGWMPIDANGWVFLCWFAPFFLLSIAAFEEMSRGYGNIVMTEQYNFARFAAFAWATLGLLMGPRKFRVTNKSMSQRQQAFLQVLPQWALMGLSVAAVLWGSWQWYHGPYLPVYAFWFNLAWVVVNLVCGIGLMRHIARTERYHQRNEYRFDVPLPLAVGGWGEDAHSLAQRKPSLTIDNISSDGCHVNGLFPWGVRPGQSLAGLVHMPGGVQPVRLDVVESHAMQGDGYSDEQAVRCKLQWANDAARDNVEQLLFGNDLQWHLQSLEERGSTPSQWLLGHWVQLKSVQAERWQLCDVSYQVGHQLHAAMGMVAMPRNGDAPQRLVLLQPVPVGSLAQLVLQRPGNVRRILCKLDKVQDLQSTAGAMYLASMEQVLMVMPGQQTDAGRTSHSQSREDACEPQAIPV